MLCHGVLFATTIAMSALRNDDRDERAANLSHSRAARHASDVPTARTTPLRRVPLHVESAAARDLPGGSRAHVGAERAVVRGSGPTPVDEQREGCAFPRAHAHATTLVHFRALGRSRRTAACEVR